MKSLKILIIFISLSLQNIYAQSNESVWDFPIRPGTEEWEKLDSYEEKLNSYNIPDEILLKMTTGDLVNTCLNYPEFRLIMTRNNLQQGYDYVRSIFNGFRELENRKDAGKELLKLYTPLNPEKIIDFEDTIEKGRYFFKIAHIELIMGQYSILNNMDNVDKKYALEQTINKYQKKKEMLELYSQLGLATSALVPGRLLELHNQQSFMDLKKNNPGIDWYLKIVYSPNPQDLDLIVENAKELLITLEGE